MPRDTNRSIVRPSMPELPTEAWDRLEKILARFEDVWRRGEEPDLDAFLAEAGAAERRALLIELVHEDLAYRFQARGTPRVETYLERYPELAGDAALAVDLIAAEYALRRRREQDLTPDSYLRRFPVYSRQLGERLDARQVAAAAEEPSSEDKDPGQATPAATPNPAASATPSPESAANRTGPYEPAVADGTPPMGLNDYEILGELGHGGMGVVYKARHLPLQRVVALKMIRAGAHASPDERLRFVREAEAVARLQHPHIVQIYEVGQAQGLPFFALEYVEGGGLDRKLDGTPMPARQAAELLETLARAIHAAHERGIVHRDLKPANVLLTADGQPKITDFGLAKQLDSGPGQTQSGAIVGTPSYMAPEQAGGKNKAIGPPADVYALGAILYELLTGRPPFKAETPLDTVFQMLSQEPVPPSRLQPKVPRDLETICLKCLGKEPAKRYATAEALADDLRRWLHSEPIQARPVSRFEILARWCYRHPAPATAASIIVVTVLAAFAIVMHSLNHEIEAKTQAVLSKDAAVRLAKEKAELADNNGKLAGEKAGLADRNGKLADKNGRLATANAALASKEKLAREATEKALRREEQARKEKEAELLLARSNLFTGQLLRVRAVFERDPAQGRQLLHDYNACALDLRDSAWYLYDRACRGREPVTLARERTAFTGVAFLSNGTLVSAGATGTVSLWDLATGKERRLAQGQLRLTLPSVAAGGGLVATYDGAAVQLWDATTGTARGTITPVPRSLIGDRPFALSRDGQTLVTATAVSTGATGPITLIGLAGPGFPAAPLRAVASVSRGLPASTFMGIVQVWDPITRRRRAVLSGNSGLIWSVAISADGRTLACGENDLVRVWDLATGRERAILRGHSFTVKTLAFSPTRLVLASGDRDGVVKIWDLAAGKLLGTVSGGRGAVHSVAFSPDGRSLAIAREDRSSMAMIPHLGASVPCAMYLLDLASGRGLTLLGKDDAGVKAVAFSPDGQTLVSAGSEERLAGRGSFATPSGKPAELRLWPLAPKFEQRVLTGHEGWVNAIAFGRGGKMLATGGKDGTVRLWDPLSGKALARFVGRSAAPAKVPGTAKVAGQAGAPTAPVEESAPGQRAINLPRRTSAVWAVACSPDGKIVAGAGEDGVVRLWDADTGKERPALTGHEGGVRALAFSPDGKTLASAGDDKTVRFWDPDTGRGRAVLKGHAHTIFAIAFSSDGSVLASGGGAGAIDRAAGLTFPAFGEPRPGVGAAAVQGELRLWDVRAAGERAVFHGQASVVRAVAFSPDGKTLASGSGVWDDQKQQWLGNELRLWDVATGRAKYVLPNQASVTWALAFSPDGRSLACGGDGLLRLGDALTGQERAAFLAQGSTQSQGVHQFDKAGRALDVRGHGPRGAVWSVAYSPDGRTLACGGADGAVRTYEVAGGSQRAVLGGHGQDVTTVAFSRDGKRLASASGPTARLWDADSGREVTVVRVDEAWSRVTAFSAELRLLASFGWTVHLRDLDTGREREFAGQPQHEFLAAAAFSPDDKTLAVSSGTFEANKGAPARHLRLWDVTEGRLKLALPDQSGAVAALAWSPDGRTLAAGDSTGVVRLWDVATARECGTLRGPPFAVTSLAFSRDGHVLAAGSGGGAVRLWDVPACKELATLDARAGPVWCVAFSPDGKRLASGTGPLPRRYVSAPGFPTAVDRRTDGKVYLWEVGSGHQQAAFWGHTGRVRSVVFRPDGKTLASSSDDQTVRLWEVPPE